MPRPKDNHQAHATVNASRAEQPTTAISPGKLSSAALRESEARFRSAFDYAPIGMALVAPDGRWLQVNRSLCEIVGYSEKELLAKKFQELTHSDDLKAEVENAHRLVAHETDSYQMEKRYIHKRGHVVWVLLSVSLIRDELDEPLYFISQTQDITGRKRAEEALAHERELFNTLMNTAPDFIYFKDKDSRFTRVNQAQARVLGLQSPKQAIGKSDFDFFTPDHARAAFADEQAIFASGQPLIGKPEYIRRADGEFRWHSTTKVPICDSDGQVVGTAGISRDVTEHKLLEDQLKQLKDYQETLIQSANDIIYTIDPSGHFTFANQRATKLSGYPVSQWVGKHFLVLLPPEDRVAVANRMRGLPVDESQSFDLRLRTRQGRTLELAVNTTPIIENKKFVGTLGIARDMTEQKRLERQVQDVKEYLESLISHAGTAIATFDLDGRVKTWNREASALFGYSSEELVGTRSTFMLVPESLRAEAAETFKRALAGEVVHAVSTQFVRRDGSTVDVLISTSPVRDVSGQVVAVAMTGTDISTSVRLERVVRDERDRLDAILRSMAEGVLVTDADYNLISMNRAAEELIGVSREELVGRSLDLLTLPVTRADLDKYLEHHTLDEGYRGRVRAWGSKMLDVTITPLRDLDGELAGTVSLVRDVTELMRVDEMKSEFISLVSHELRTPLTAIKGYTDLILAGDTGAINAEQEEFLSTVKANVDRLVLLINDLLDISKIEAGRLKLHPSEIDLAALFGEIIRSFKPQLAAKHQIISADLSKDTRVMADRDRLSQVLWNLLSNAHKYSPVGARIGIRVAPIDATRLTASNPDLVDRRAPLLAFSIEDEGIGITADEQAKLFTKFYRVDNSLTREVGGTGLGLAIVKSFVELHGGRVWVDSPADVTTQRGSRFTFTIPAAVEPALTVAA